MKQPAACTSAFRRASADFLRAEAGTTAIEYSLIASGIAVAIALTIVHLGERVTGLFAVVAAAVS